MAAPSPLRPLHQLAEATFVPYGPAILADAVGGADRSVQIVATFGELEVEYAAIRKACVLMDRPDRGTLELVGPDRGEFLNRMLTQELKGLAAFHVRRSFWLNRRGRIDADVRVIELPDRTLLDLDIHAAERTLRGLSAFIVSEDAKIADASAARHRLSLHGPTALPLLREIARPMSAAVNAPASAPPNAPSLQDLAEGTACTVSIAGREVIVDRDDSTGEVGLELLMDAAAVQAVYEQLIEAGQQHDGNGNGAADSPAGPTAGAARFRLRPCGWYAYNTARIEAGRPLYNVDFGPDSLPHETGVLRDRVSFTKGCYLGQEIVARMESRGHPKALLVALRCESRPIGPDAGGGAFEEGSPIEQAVLPVAGAHVYPGVAPTGPAASPVDPVGAVTSSTFSPMLSAAPIGFAMVKWGHHEPGTALRVAADGAMLPAVVRPTLRFLPPR